MSRARYAIGALLLAACASSSTPARPPSAYPELTCDAEPIDEPAFATRWSAMCQARCPAPSSGAMTSCSREARVLQSGDPYVVQGFVCTRAAQASDGATERHFRGADLDGDESDRSALVALCTRRCPPEPGVAHCRVSSAGASGDAPRVVCVSARCRRST